MPIYLIAAALLLAQTPDDRLRGIVSSEPFTQAAAFIATDQDRFVRELVTLRRAAEARRDVPADRA